MRKELEDRYAHIAAQILHDRMTEGDGGNLICMPPMAGLFNKSLFEEGWDVSPFESDDFRPGAFTNALGEVLQVPMMHYVTDAYYEDHLFVGAVVPLGERTDISLVLLMPKDHNSDLLFLAKAVHFSRVRRNLKKAWVEIGVPPYDVAEDDLLLYLTQEEAREIEDFNEDVKAYFAQGYAEDEDMPFVSEGTDEVLLTFSTSPVSLRSTPSPKESAIRKP